MPKLSKATASHVAVPGYMDEYEQEIGDWTVTVESIHADADLAPLFKGAPGDVCQASHVGYVIEGRFGVRHADGSEETYEAGDAFVLGAGHTPINYAGGKIVAFTPTEEARQLAAVVFPNLVQFAKEQGIELPAELVESMQPRS